MSLTRRYLRPQDLEGALTAIGNYETKLEGFIKVVFTRQTAAEWSFYMGQCALDQDAQEDQAEVYRNFAFVTKALRGGIVKAIVAALNGSGIDIGHGLPPVRISVSPPSWNEEITPTFVTRSRTPARRFTVSITPNAYFPDSQLIDYTLPYRPSAARYVKEFLGLQTFYGADDARKGELFIEIPDRRGAIRFAGGMVSIHDPRVPLRLVGTINDDIPVDVRNDNFADYDEEAVRSIELSLLTEENELVDFISTTDWPYKYPLPQEGAQEQQRLTLIRGGESEICEFKPYIDLTNEKAAELEKSVCAFSNQRGGTLFVGVDKDAEIVGLTRELARKPDDVEQAVAVYEKASATGSRSR